MTDTRYIVVVFYGGVGHTYQWGYKLGIFFSSPAIAYKKLAYAIKAANMLYWKYACIDKVCVFKVVLDERLSCDQYNKWCDDENRCLYSKE